MRSQNYICLNIVEHYLVTEQQHKREKPSGNIRGITLKIATFFFNTMYFCKLFKEELIQKVI